MATHATRADFWQRVKFTRHEKRLLSVGTYNRREAYIKRNLANESADDFA